MQKYRKNLLLEFKKDSKDQSGLPPPKARYRINLLQLQDMPRKALSLGQPLKLTRAASHKERSFDAKKDINVGRVRYSILSKNQDRQFINKYKKGRQIGRGSFSTVFQVSCEDSLFAAKMYKSGSRKKSATAQNEISVLKRLRHKFILPLLQIIDDPNQSKTYLISEYCKCGGMLSALHKSNRPSDFHPERPNCMTESAALLYFDMLLKAVRFLHEHGIAHLDIKPENVLITESGQVRLADFGQAMTVSKRTAANFTGTPIFMAPERFTHDNFCPHASDMWAVGVTFYVALCGDYPFKGVTLSAFRQEIAEKDVTYPSWLNPKLKEMLQQLLHKSELRRARAAQIKIPQL